MILLGGDRLALKILNLEGAAHQPETVIAHERAELVLRQLGHSASEKCIEGIQGDLVGGMSALYGQLGADFRHVHHELSWIVSFIFALFIRAVYFVVFE